MPGTKKSRQCHRTQIIFENKGPQLPMSKKRHKDRVSSFDDDQESGAESISKSSSLLENIMWWAYVK